jgi:hypothetical protein
MLYALTSELTNGHDYTINMNQSTVLGRRDDSFEVGLVSSMICYGWPNISQELANNIIKYRIDGTAAWNTITVSDGTYTIVQLDELIKREMKANGHYDAGADTREIATSDDLYYITMGANESTGRVVITLAGTYQLDLSQSRIWDVLGFTSTTVLATAGRHEGTEVPDFNRDVNQVQIRCDIIANNASFVNGRAAPILYGLNPEGQPYGFISVKPMQIIYLPMNTRVLDRINIKITDQDGNILTVGGERTTVLIDIRKMH